MKGGAEMAKEQLVKAFHEDKVYSFERVDTHSWSSFGGPLDYEIMGDIYGPRPVHMIAVLSEIDLPFLQPVAHLWNLPLIYGLSYSGFRMQYIVKNKEVKVVEVYPHESSEDFPYRNFPILLPYFPMRVSSARSSSYEKFADKFPNMPENQPSDLVVAVPAPATIGMSLWGRPANPEDVNIVFECSLEHRFIRTYNVCE
jgi:hypothetical protein